MASASAPAPTAPVASSSLRCSLCTDPLLSFSDPGESEDLQLENEMQIDSGLVLDDVELECGHHYHWQCVLDYAEENGPDAAACAVCAIPLYQGVGHGNDGEEGQFLVIVRNEGGETPDFDLGAEIAHQRFLAANPRIARAETFLSLVEQGDADAAEAFLNADPENGGEPVDVNAIKRGTGQTALHLAALNNDEPGVRMLLAYGADRTIEDDTAETAADCAKSVKAENVLCALAE
ncbi:ankyrin [Auriculariales sp. MPI-PUGE-AT-0066]|nr:ankyrin [Auriculariales sp. MPI-PUGE-AT-0066]